MQKETPKEAPPLGLKDSSGILGPLMGSSLKDTISPLSLDGELTRSGLPRLPRLTEKDARQQSILPSQE